MIMISVPQVDHKRKTRSACSDGWKKQSKLYDNASRRLLLLGRKDIPVKRRDHDHMKY